MLIISKEDIPKYILLLRKGVYLYKYISVWENFNETSLPEKNIYKVTLTLTILLMETRSKGKHLEYNFLEVEVSESFPKKCLEVIKLDPACFLFAPR